VPRNPQTVGAIIGSTLIALLLTGSPRIAASNRLIYAKQLCPEILATKDRAKKYFAAGQYEDARRTYVEAAKLARQLDVQGEAARNWNSAGACAIVTGQFRVALEEFSLARGLAEAAQDPEALTAILNNLASLYMQTGQYDLAMRLAQQGLVSEGARIDPKLRSKLRFQLAGSLTVSGRLGEAKPIYRAAFQESIDHREFSDAVPGYGVLGTAYLKAGRLPEAEAALNEGLRLAKQHKLRISGNILSGLAKVKSRQGDQAASEDLFAQALNAPSNRTPRWVIYADRGQARLNAGKLQEAWSDFRESARIAANLRADMVPADTDRVAFESGLSLVYEGLVETGNLLSRQIGQADLLEATFDAAEQDRLWSLRALVPSPSDWRTKLPPGYWERLARYQAMQRSAMGGSSGDLDGKATALRDELQQMEAAAAGQAASDTKESPLAHVRHLLDADSVLLSFHITQTSSWIWAVDRTQVAVFPLPPLTQLSDEVHQYSRALREGGPSDEVGARLYHDLFGTVPSRFLANKHWKLELDGPLYELPFAALPTGKGKDGATFLIEKADLGILPGALLATRGNIPADGAFLGVGDPIYNAADSRFEGAKGKAALSLPRLPNTSPEIEACARAWNTPGSRLLAGAGARIDSVRDALQSDPAIVHFATHVVTGKGDFQSGMIALSLDSGGAMGLLGPREIVARATGAKLIVMNGCHSAQGEALPSAGLMGLTRAWIGAGALSVMATQWDVPDGDSQVLLSGFYRALKASPEGGAAAALRNAQIAAIHLPGGRQQPHRWAGYFLLSRML
jgi:tetratricopeptide (TPR) repeat protein